LTRHGASIGAEGSLAAWGDAGAVAAEWQLAPAGVHGAHGEHNGRVGALRDVSGDASGWRRADCAYMHADQQARRPSEPMAPIVAGEATSHESEHGMNSPGDTGDVDVAKATNDEEHERQLEDWVDHGEAEVLMPTHLLLPRVATQRPLWEALRRRKPPAGAREGSRL
jgi:hypothetical protein